MKTDCHSKQHTCSFLCYIQWNWGVSGKERPEYNGDVNCFLCLFTFFSYSRTYTACRKWMPFSSWPCSWTVSCLHITNNGMRLGVWKNLPTLRQSSQSSSIRNRGRRLMPAIRVSRMRPYTHTWVSMIISKYIIKICY